VQYFEQSSCDKHTTCQHLPVCTHLPSAVQRIKPAVYPCRVRSSV
jgi:hypothetical protein